MKTELPLSKLEEAVHQALNAWHHPGIEVGALTDLQIFRQARLDSDGNVRQATNKILLEGLEALRIDHEVEAALLRKRFLDGLAMYVVANQFNLSEAQAYRKQKEAIKQLAMTLQAKEVQAREERRQQLEQRLEPPTYVQLVGIDDHLDSLLSLLTVPGPPWLISVEGLGGLGKTSLADALSRQIISQGLFADFGWVSARQHIFNLGGGIKPIDSPALTEADLIEKLVTQFIPNLLQPATFATQAGLMALQTRLKQQAHLVVIDNLETVTDLERVMPVLRSLVEPTKILITSRKSLYYEPGLYHFNLPPLSETNTLRLIRNEARLHNLAHLQEANDDELRRIYQVVGGNPLALRLVVGQTHVHGLDAILADLAAARGQKIELLYTFIYRRAWEMLTEPTRQVFLAMPLVTNMGGSADYLVQISGLELSQVRDALEQLVALNLVNSQGDLTDRRFSIHNLTRTFLQEQVARWQ